jgi:hypothetical protein
MRDVRHCSLPAFCAHFLFVCVVCDCVCGVFAWRVYCAGPVFLASLGVCGLDASCLQSVSGLQGWLAVELWPPQLTAPVVHVAAGLLHNQVQAPATVAAGLHASFSLHSWSGQQTATQ